MRKLMIISVFCFCSATGAWATPSLTADQSSRLQAALDAQGCVGGHINVGESGFEIVGAKCGGGMVYDLVFDHDYKMLRKDAQLSACPEPFRLSWYRRKASPFLFSRAIHASYGSGSASM